MGHRCKSAAIDRRRKVPRDDNDRHNSDERWLAAQLPFIRRHLPPAPARVLEIGCGPLGGFVPGLLADAYDVVGVDPEAPDGPSYHRVELEQYDVQQPLDAIVACTSLHHVVDLDDVLDRVGDALVPGGTLVVVEWAHERFDEATARWCFDRLAPPDHGGNWLHRRRDGWQASGQSWDSYIQAWVDDEGLHHGDTIVQALRARFATSLSVRTPYFFADLDNVTEAAEQAAIDSDRIRPTGIRYVGRRS